MRVLSTGKIVGLVLHLERLRQVFPRFVRQDVGWFLVVRALPNEPDDFCAATLMGEENEDIDLENNF